MNIRKEVPPQQLMQQQAFMHKTAQWNQARQAQNEVKLKYFTHTYGCQQNEADTQRIAGMLQQMDFAHAQTAEEADLIILNTCAVRENAENRVLGNVGAMAHLKKAKPHLLIALCGCMVQQPHMAEKIKKSYPQVDLVFGTNALWRFPELLYTAITEKHRLIDISGEDMIAEGLPVEREGSVHAWLSIMYGCNNFCTYCIVPYVRGRERSRKPEEIEKELRQLVAKGYKDITLLGQNVNSYGKDLDTTVDFSDLLYRLNAVPGDFRLRFMTSHPKDASQKLFDTMAACEKLARQLHLPVQSGSDEILQKMNRGYTAAQYLELITYARKKMPDLVVSSDIIVGFPGESAQDFEKTLDLVRTVKYDMLYTFQYSKRSGTPAAEYPDDTPKQTKQERFERLLHLQDSCAEPKMLSYQGKQVTVLVDGQSTREEYPYTARTDGNLLVYCAGERLEIGKFYQVEIEKAALRNLYGRVREH